MTTPEARERRREYQRERLRELRRNPETREVINARARERYATDPEFRERRRKANAESSRKREADRKAIRAALKAFAGIASTTRREALLKALQESPKKAH
jgi:hypothetical protein